MCFHISQIMRDSYVYSWHWTARCSILCCHLWPAFKSFWNFWGSIARCELLYVWIVKVWDPLMKVIESVPCKLLNSVPNSTNCCIFSTPVSSLNFSNFSLSLCHLLNSLAYIVKETFLSSLADHCCCSCCSTWSCTIRVFE